MHTISKFHALQLNILKNKGSQIVTIFMVDFEGLLSYTLCGYSGPVHMGRSYLGYRENISTSLQARSCLVMK